MPTVVDDEEKAAPRLRHPALDNAAVLLASRMNAPWQRMAELLGTLGVHLSHVQSHARQILLPQVQGTSWAVLHVAPHPNLQHFEGVVAVRLQQMFVGEVVIMMGV